MLYLLDANVLITANRTYYPLERVPEYWAWLVNRIAYALVDPAQRRVVTTEGSKPSATRANRKIPDVCRDLMIECGTPFDLNRTLNFSTNWQ